MSESREQRTENRKRKSDFCYPLFSVFCFFLTACSGQIKGSVFLDSNSNGILDQREIALGNIAVKVSHDNELVATTITDSQGHFSVGSKGTGYYCVEVMDVPALSQVLMNRVTAPLPEGAPSVSPPLPNPVLVLPPPSSKPRGPAAGKEVGGTTTPSCGNHIIESPEECDDGNTQSGDGCSSACKNETQRPSSTATPASPPRPSKVSSGSVCQNLDGISLTVHVPVNLDYQAEISRMPEPSLKNYKPGDSFEIAIPVPVGCFLKTLFIPDVFEIAPDQIDPSIDMIDPKIGRIDFREDMLTSSVGLSLKVKSDKNIVSGRFGIEPEALCPDGQTVPIKVIEIELNTKPDIKIEQNVSYRERPGLKVSWELTVQNASERDYGSITIKATPPSDTTVDDDAGCNVSGGVIECSADLAPDKTINKTFQVKLKGLEENQHTTVYFRASVTFSDYPDTISAPEKGLDVP